MWRNYLTVALRVLTKERTYAFINVVGLALGLAACLALLLYVRYERSYDSWLPGHDDVYELQTFYTDSQTGEAGAMQMTQYVAGTTLRQHVPQIANGVYAMTSMPTVLRGREALGIERALMVDGNLLDILRLPLAYGDPRTALSRVGAVLLSEAEARRIFGDANPVGRTVTLVEHGAHVDHAVTGVFRDLPRNSSLRFGMIVRFDPPSFFADQPEWLTSFGDFNGWYFLRLRPGADPATVHDAMPAWRDRYMPPAMEDGRVTRPGEGFEWRLVNIGDVHLGEAQAATMTEGNDQRTLITYTVAALLILGIACFNFVNLATARALRRAREVALRKVLGASRRQLIVQFLGESILVAVAAMLIALALLELALPALRRVLDADLGVDYGGDPLFIGAILALVLLAGAVGGLYPAFYVSRFQPALVLKSSAATPETGRSGLLRSLLVVFQFAVSIGLIVCTIVVYGQSVYGSVADPGYRRGGLLQIGIEGIANPERGRRSEALVRELEQVPGVVSAGRTSIGVATPNHSNTSLHLPGREPVSLGNYRVDEGFFETMGMRLVAGRGFDVNRPMDRSGGAPPGADPAVDQALIARGANVVVNELAARRLGFANPADAVGARAEAAFLDAGPVPVTIVGVVNDTRFRSIREPIDPIMFRFADDFLSHIVVRYDGIDPAAVRERVRRVWQRVEPDVPFDGEFSEDIVERLYGQEQARASVFAGFACLALTIACLGLFGLAALTAERRTKEIGIRKVLGARTRDIVQLLAWQFSKPVIVANLIAWPAAWWAMREWLNTFDARIGLGPEPFVLAAVLALVLAIGTIAGHAIKVARANPIHALRYE
ncbi:MAG TPA: ABC transporter permease [Allosphingosinicella sp.]|nr:ABC transporter permease [Allosphingosinicella sp.]